MNRVILQADGQLSYDDHPIQAGPLRYLGFEVVLAPACTLRSFFQCMARHPGMAALNPFLDSFLEYYQRCPANGCTYAEIDHLALSRTVEIIGYPAPARMELSVSLEGFRGVDRHDILVYGLESLLDIPLKLGCLNHVVFGDQLNTMQFDTVFNLFELIDGICWQLSFHNLPATCRLAPEKGPS